MAHAKAAVLPQKCSDMGGGNAYAGRMLDRMPRSLEKVGRRTKNRLRSLEEPYETYMAHSGVWKNRMKRMLDGVQDLRGIKKDGVSFGVFLVHVVVSSAELAALKSKPFRNFSVISASSSLFLRGLAGYSGINRRKEKPPETCLFPVV